MSGDACVRMLTPPGLGGIAVVELAGRDAESILRTLFHTKARAAEPPEPSRIAYGRIVRRGETLDEVIVARIPVDSTTPIFEIGCHGGMVPARRIIESFVESGAREVDEGNTALGRELKKIERKLFEQLINARTTLAADVLLVQLSGRLRSALEEIVSVRDRAEAHRLIDRLRATGSFGRRLVEPATVVITGAPNVGKSTLSNALVGRERSIVHHLPGTTRDAVASVASLDGLPVVVVDTAGLREATDEIERLGVAKAVARAAGCDLVVWVFDHSRDVTADESRCLDVLKSKPLVAVVNKIDLKGPVSAPKIHGLVHHDVLRTCALTGRGIDELRKKLFATLAGADVPNRDSAVVTLNEVADALALAAQKIDSKGETGYLLDELLR